MSAIRRKRTLEGLIRPSRAYFRFQLKLVKKSVIVELM